MRDVMMKAQELGETILKSEIYQRAKAADDAVRRDEEAAALLGKYMEAQGKVNSLLSAAEVDPEAIAQAGAEMESAQEQLRAHPLVKEMQAANEECNKMLDNVNRLIQFIVHGTAGDGCTGSCETCGGCH